MANLPKLSTNILSEKKFNLELNEKPLVEVSNTIEKLNVSLNKFSFQLKTSIDGLSKNIKDNNKLLKNDESMNKFLNNLFPKQYNEDSKKAYTNLNDTLEKFTNNLEPIFNKERTQSLFNLTFKQVAKDTFGTITDKFTDKFKNNALIKGFTNLKDAFKVLRGGASSLIGSAAGRRTERTQEQIELDNEKIEREERTNELLEDILEALLTGNKLEKEKKNTTDDSGFFPLPLLTAGALAAATGAASVLKDYPGVISGINSLRNFFNALKEFELPKISQIKNWIDEFRDLIKTKITGTDDVAKTTTWVDDLMKWSNNFKESIKSKIKTPAAADALDGELSKTSKWIDGLTTTIQKYKLPPIDEVFNKNWQKFTDFFGKLKTDILEKYNLPSIDDIFGQKWQKFTDFFSELSSKLPTINLPTIDDIGSKINTMKDGIVNFKNNVTSFIDGTKAAINDTAKIVTGVKNAKKSTSAAAAASDYSKATGNLGPVNDYKDFLMGKPQPSSVSSVANATKASDSVGVFSKMKNAIFDSPTFGPAAKTITKAVTDIPGKLFSKTLKALPFVETALVAGVSPEDVTGVTNKEAYEEGIVSGLKNNLDAAGVQAQYSFGASGLYDLFTGTDTRETRFNLDKDLSVLSKTGPLAPLRAFAEVALGGKYKEKYDKPDTAINEISNWLSGTDGEAKKKAAKLILTEEGMDLFAKPDLGGTGSLVIGNGFNFYPIKEGTISEFDPEGEMTSVFDMNEKAKASGAPKNKKGTYLSMTEKEAEPILLYYVDKFHNDLLKIKDKVDGEFIGNIYSEMTEPARKAAVISLAFQTGLGRPGNNKEGIRGFQNMWKNINKANNSGDTKDWEAAGKEMINSKTQRQLLDAQTGPDKKATRMDRAFETMRDNNLSLKEGFDENKIKFSAAASGAVSYGPRLLLTGEYENAKQNPELTAPINFIKDEMTSTTEKIVKTIVKQNQINDMLKETTMEQRLMKMFEKTNEMSNRLKQKEGMETSRAKLSVPIVNNVVDNKQVNNNNQSVLMKQTAYNPQNVFRLA